MAQLVSREELSSVLEEQISEERFNAAYTIAIRVVRSAYRGDPEEAGDDAFDTVASVFQGVITRILTNPKGARTVGLGSANLTFGGADAEITRVFTLYPDEREALAEVSRVRRTGAFTINPVRRS